jgi:hypothetical protein
VRRSAIPAGQRESGATLLLGLLLLTALSLLGLAAVTDSTLQVRMAGNLEAEEAALQRARSALAWGERWLLSLEGTVRPAPCASASCDPALPIHETDDSLVPERQDDRWWRDHAVKDGLDPALGLLVADRTPTGAPAARWRVEELHVTPATDGTPELGWYRVLAWAPRTGVTEPVLLESILARPWGDSAWRDALERPRAQPSFCMGLDSGVDCGRRAWRRRR